MAMSEHDPWGRDGSPGADADADPDPAARRWAGWGAALPEANGHADVDPEAMVDAWREPDAALGSGLEAEGGAALEVGALIGRVASPPRHEATTDRFFFWVPRQVLIEKTQLVRTECTIGGRPIVFHGVVEEVYRRSRRQSMDEEVDTFDGDLSFQPPFAADGITYAAATILRTRPPILTPPLEQSPVWLGGRAEAEAAYGYDAMRDEVTGADWGLPIGLLRNGGSARVGTALIDLRDLAGDRAGHLNVTGQAGRATKSSFLLFVVRSLIDAAQRLDDGNPDREPFSVRPIVFNVKGNDLLYIDLPNRHLTAERRQLWAEVGLEPRPFTAAEFHAPCRPGNRAEPRVLRAVEAARQTRPYDWTLADVVRFGLWTYLFSDESQTSEPFGALVDHVLDLIAEDCPADRDHPAGLRLRPAGEAPQSFAELREWLHAALRDRTHPVRDHGVHAFGTCRALLSRLGLVLGREGAPIFDAGPGRGRPLHVLADGTTDPVVIDIAGLPTELRRFVVAAVLDQVKAHQMGERRVRGQVYFLVLDELGIYAPRGGRDAITRLFEHVAAQLRSQGIILLGAQQQANKVSETIFGNSEVKALGATSPVELESGAWSHLLTPAQKSRALVLQPDEKLVLTGRGWMNVVVPFPAWAMKRSEAVDPDRYPTLTDGGRDGRAPDAIFELNERDE